MTSHEKESFLSMLFRALQRIDDHIVMEQHNLSPELCDYLLSIKKAPDSGTFVYDADAEDQYFHYSDLDSRSSGSFPVNLEALDFAENELTIHGFFKVYTRFPTPSKLFLRLTSEKGTQTLDCNLEEDRSKGAAFNEHQLSVTEYFTASIPYKLLKTKTTVELCMLSGDHVPEQPLPAGRSHLLRRLLLLLPALLLDLLTDLLECPDQLCTRDRLHQIIRDSDVDCLFCILELVIPAQEYDLGLRQLVLHETAQLQSIHERHLNVRDQNIRSRLLDDRIGELPVARVTDKFKAFTLPVDVVLYALPHNDLIFR